MSKPEINNEIVLLRKNVVQARVHTIKKLSREIKKLRDKKGTDAQKAKNLRKADRMAAEIQAIKKIKKDDITRFALTSSMTLEQILNDQTSDPSKRIQARITNHKKFSEKIVQLKEKHPNYLQFLEPGRRKKSKLERQEKKKLNKEAKDMSTNNRDEEMKEKSGDSSPDDTDLMIEKDTNSECENNVKFDEKKIIKLEKKGKQKIEKLNSFQKDDDSNDDDDDDDDDEELVKQEREILSDGSENDDQDVEIKEKMKFNRNKKNKLKEDINTLQSDQDSDENDDHNEDSEVGEEMKKERLSSESENEDDEEEENISTDKDVECVLPKKDKKHVKKNENMKSKNILLHDVTKIDNTPDLVKSKKALKKEKKLANMTKAISKLATVKKFEEMLKENNTDLEESEDHVIDSCSMNIDVEKEVDPFFITNNGESNFLSVAPRKRQINPEEDKTKDSSHSGAFNSQKHFKSRQTNSKFDSNPKWRNQQNDDHRFNNNKLDSKWKNKNFNRSRFDNGNADYKRRNENLKFPEKEKRMGFDKFNDKAEHRPNRRERRNQMAEAADAKNLHPSWEAKKKQQDALKLGFQGKKIVFGDN